MRNFLMEDIHVYLFVLVGFIVAVYMMTTLSPTTPVYGEEYTVKYVYQTVIVPKDATQSERVPKRVVEIEIKENITEDNFSSKV